MKKKLMNYVQKAIIGAILVFIICSVDHFVYFETDLLESIGYVDMEQCLILCTLGSIGAIWRDAVNDILAFIKKKVFKVRRA